MMKAIGALFLSVAAAGAYLATMPAVEEEYITPPLSNWQSVYPWEDCWTVQEKRERLELYRELVSNDRDAKECDWQEEVDAGMNEPNWTPTARWFDLLDEANEGEWIALVGHLKDAEQRIAAADSYEVEGKYKQAWEELSKASCLVTSAYLDIDLARIEREQNNQGILTPKADPAKLKRLQGQADDKVILSAEPVYFVSTVAINGPTISNYQASHIGTIGPEVWFYASAEIDCTDPAGGIWAIQVENGDEWLTLGFGELQFGNNSVDATGWIPWTSVPGSGAVIVRFQAFESDGDEAYKLKAVEVNAGGGI